MNTIKFFIGICLLILVSTVFVQAQITEDMARQELAKRGLDEFEVRQKLLERGIDLDNVDPTNVVQVQMVEQALREVVAELEEEKRQGNLKKEGGPTKKVEEKGELTEEQSKEVAKDSEEISEAIEDGATLEEAVSEELIESQEEKLPPTTVFGQQIFRNNGIKLYRKSEDVKPPDDYVLGVGDKVTVSIWGYSQESIVFEIDEAGYIKPPELPRIYLKGIRLGKAKKLLESRFGQYYRFRPQEFEVTVNYSRTININIVGEVYNYGSFSIPAINTAFNALIAAGGPSDIGSVRNITLFRANQSPQKIDIYEYLLDPSISKNFYLEENDYIHVPVADRLVRINGAVKRPLKYELIEGENLLKLIEFAGGFTDNALQGNIRVKRFVDDQEVIEDVDYKKLERSGKDFVLFPGDVVTINQIPKAYDNFVEISGAVETPGEYEVSSGMRLTELLDKSILLKDARKDIAYLRRMNLDRTVRYEQINISAAFENPGSDANIVLQAEDKITVYAQKTFVDRSSITITGSVRTPGTHIYNPNGNLKLYDAIILAGGLRLNAAKYAYVKRTNLNNSKNKSYLRIDIKEVANNPNSEDNIDLEASDVVYVYSDEKFTDASSVTVNGRIRTPGSFDYDEGLRVSDLIYFANGLQPDAQDYAYLHRTNINNKKRGAYVRVNIKEAIENPESNANILLEPLDELVIYSNETFFDEATVTVNGSVYAGGTYKYHPDLTVRDILSMSGGVTIQGDPSRVDVSRIVFENGKPVETVVANLSLDDQLNVTNGNFDLEPFDYIYVRTLPNYGLQEFLNIEGEVKYPGPYALTSENETVYSVVQRTGGLTNESFPEGATLFRKKENIGYIVIKLDEIMKNPRSKFNVILQEGDQLIIPKKKDLVTIKGQINAIELYDPHVAKSGKINVAYHKRKNAKFYVNKFAGGVGDKGRRRLITVEHPNGEIRRTRNFFFFKIYPKVRKGSVIIVNGVEEKKQVASTTRERTDWGRVLSSTVAQATAVLSLILLVQNVD